MSMPALRFREFTENWQLDNLLSLSENGFTNGVFNDPAKVGSGYKLVNVLDMYIETTIDETKLKLVELDEAEFIKNKVEHGDVFFTRSSLVKEGIAYSNTYLGKSEDITFDGHLIRMRPKKDLINSSFLNYLLKTSSPRSQLVKRGKTATMTTIGQADIAEVVIKFPSKPEQTKIANFLTAVDEKITHLTQKHELLTQYKKGVMQQIFSQELRFKDDDGHDFPEWEDTTLGELCSITTGKLDANAMIENGEYRFYTCAKEFYRIDDYAFDTDALLVSGNGANVGYIHHYKGKFNAYQRTYVLDRFEENIIFIKYFLDAFLHVRIFKEAKEGNTPYIVMGTLTEMSVRLPKLAEQTKIANFLTAIDDKISSTKTQLQAVKQYKQGLLQQMFV